MAKTELLIQTVGGLNGPHLSIEPESLTYKYRHNRPGAIEFTVKDTHPEVSSDTIAARKHEALVRRDNVDRWVGPILTLDEGRDGLLTFRGEGLMWYLKGFHVTSNLSYSATDQFAILRGYVQHHLDKSGAAKFNLSLDTSESSGVTRDRQVFGWERLNVYDAMIDFTELNNGFDVEMRASDRTLHMHYPRRGIRRENARFGDVQIKEFNRRQIGDEVASEVLGIGAGSQEDTLQVARGNSVAKAEFGLSQRLYTNKDVKRVSTLRSHADRELEQSRRIQNLISLTVRATEPAVFSYDVDDEVFIDYASRYKPIQEYQHLVGYDVVIERGREERVVLYLNPL